MKTFGIIAEYNPFHNGHKYLIDKAKEMGATHTVAVMSGNFVQRGEPALFNTAARVNAALDGGIDLVLQLPLPYAISGAQNFARGGVEVLNGTGVVDKLIFGTEGADKQKLSDLSDFINSGALDDEIKAQLQQGITYAKARENAIVKLKPHLADLVATPNNTLALEYVNSIKKSGSKIDFEGVCRIGAEHDSDKLSGCFASASQLRNMITAGESIKNYVPDCNLYADLPVFNTVAFNKYETAILYKMRTATAEEIALAPDVSEGIENRIKAAAESAVTLEELYSLAKTKRYTHARIRRIVLSTFLGLTAEMAAKQTPYIRVLGFNQRGAELLREIKKSATLPLVTKAADVTDLSPEAKEMFALECKATDIYNLLSEAPLPAGEEKKFVVLRSDN